MWDILNDLFWFAMGLLSLAGVFARAGDIASRFDKGTMHDGH